MSSLVAAVAEAEIEAIAHLPVPGLRAAAFLDDLQILLDEALRADGQSASTDVHRGHLARYAHERLDEIRESGHPLWDEFLQELAVEAGL